MLSVAIIVFREILEIALIVGVVIAATRGLAGRRRWIGIGMAGGMMGAGVVALFAGALTHAAEGMGQEVFNAGILFIAAALIGGTAVWMKSHAQHVTQHLRQVGEDVCHGRLPLYSLAAVIALAVWREGAEIVLFLYGMAISGQTALALAAGGLIGLAGGAAMGLLLYHGLLKLAARRMFQVTGWLLVLLSAGMASQGAKLLVDGGIFTRLITPVWSTARILPEKSIIGQALHALVGYSAQPLGIQLVFYIATLALLLAAMKSMQRTMKTAAVIVACVALHPGAAQAGIDNQVFEPGVNKGEFELEYGGTRTFGSDAGKNNAQEHEFSVGYGVTDWWHAELNGTLERGPGEPTDYTATGFENVFQFWPSGKYWLDAGMLASYHLAAKRDDADAVEMKLLLQKDIGKFTALLNTGFEREVGTHSVAGNDLASAANLRYRWLSAFEPGIEWQADMGTWHDNRNHFDQQEHYLGPVAYGTLLPELLPDLKYDVAYLFGVSEAAASSAARLHLEYEMHF